MEEKFLTQEALKSFQKGNYLRAYLIYKKLAEQIGEQFFHANIEICKKHIDPELNLENLTKDLLSSQDGYIPATLYGDCLKKEHHFRIAVILDEFSYQCWKPEAELKRLHPDQWQKEIECFQPDFLFVESAWHGENNEWKYKVSQLSEEIQQILAYCRKTSLPSVFWNKEDPVHFDEFLPATKLFDYVFTTDADCLSRYKQELGHNRVYVLPFAAQPVLHNPVETVERTKSFVFAGSWNTTYPERNADLKMQIETAREFGSVEIYDRYYKKNIACYQYPEAYRQMIVGTVPYAHIGQVYKKAVFALNVNSVQNSSTMFARRVFELLASGTIVISNASKGMTDFFGDLVLTGSTPEVLKKKIQDLWDNPAKIQEYRNLALRKIESQHTYKHRLNEILERLGKRMFSKINYHIKENIKNDNLNYNIYLVNDKCNKINLSVKDNSYYEFICRWDGIQDKQDKILLLIVNCFDKNGNIIKNDDLSYSKTVGFYKYFMSNSKFNHKELYCRLFIPEYITHITFQLHSWNNAHDFGKINLNIKLSKTDQKNKIRRQENNTLHSILSNLANTLSESNGCQYYKKINLSIGIITDEFMYNFYKDVFAHIYYLHPDNYKKILLSKTIDLILYVTLWHGINNNEWQGIKYREKQLHAFDDIIAIAHNKKIKLVFQSIEDPSNFEYFLPIAKQFDYIFTSDIYCIEKYKKECMHTNVFYAEYGINPLIDNPISCRKIKLDLAFFAGSWSYRYQERCNDMQTIFQSLIDTQYQFIIADRNYYSKDKNIKYPENLSKYTIPPFEHLILQKIHKLFQYNMNLNSIKHSETMCAMRVYELQAMGVNIISNYAKSVFNKFPSIKIINIHDNLQDYFIIQDLENYRISMNQVNNVMKNKTSYEIVENMLKCIGLKLHQHSKPNICIIIPDVNNFHTIQCIQKQTYKNILYIKEKEISTKIKWFKYQKINNISYFTWFNNQYEYEENYIQCLINGFKYTNSKYITHLSYFFDKNYIQDIEHEFTDTIGSKDRTLFSAIYFSPVDYINIKMGSQIVNIPGGYAIDPFELNYIKFLELNKKYNLNKKKILSLIIPVFNNGDFLFYKAFQSIKINKIFDQIEILIIDDGSTDSDTINCIKSLKRMYNNVITYFFNDGGSGSASRPRNKGIELATSQFISFLDPDNEISPNGYDKLLEIYENILHNEKIDIDFISGYHVKISEKVQIIGKRTNEKQTICNTLKKDFLENGKFPIIPTQPAILSSKLFTENPSFRFVEKAAGQDTLFGWELLCYAKIGVFTNSVYIIYYAERTGSIVNNINVEYFTKKLILEKYQVKKLKQFNILEQYILNHYDNFMNNWYLKKLSKINDQKLKEQCVHILKEIAKLYGKTFHCHIDQINGVSS